MGDLLQPPLIPSHYKIGKSEIHGKGIIATKAIPISAKVDIICIREYITPWFGKWINHSRNPTGVMMKLDNDWVFVTSVNIPKGGELTVNYNQTPPFIARPEELGILDK